MTIDERFPLTGNRISIDQTSGSTLPEMFQTTNQEFIHAIRQSNPQLGKANDKSKSSSLAQVEPESSQTSQQQEQLPPREEMPNYSFPTTRPGLTPIKMLQKKQPSETSLTPFEMSTKESHFFHKLVKRSTENGKSNNLYQTKLPYLASCLTKRPDALLPN